MAVYPGGTNTDGYLYTFKEGYSPDHIEIAPLPAWRSANSTHGGAAGGNTCADIPGALH